MTPKIAFAAFAAIMVCLLSGIPLDQVFLRPLLVVLMLTGAIHVMLLGASEPATGRYIGAIVVLAALASAWPGLLLAVRSAFTLNAGNRSDASWLAILTAGGLTLIAGCLLFVAKVLANRPPPARLPKPTTRRRERVINPVQPPKPPSHDPKGPERDELGLFGGDQ